MSNSRARQVFFELYPVFGVQTTALLHPLLAFRSWPPYKLRRRAQERGGCRALAGSFNASVGWQGLGKKHRFSERAPADSTDVFFDHCEGLDTSGPPRQRVVPRAVDVNLLVVWRAFRVRGGVFSVGMKIPRSVSCQSVCAWSNVACCGRVAASRVGAAVPVVRAHVRCERALAWTPAGVSPVPLTATNLLRSLGSPMLASAAAAATQFEAGSQESRLCCSVPVKTTIATAAARWPCSSRAPQRTPIDRRRC